MLIVLLFPPSAYSLDFHETGNDDVTIQYESGLEGGAERVLSMIPRLKGELQDQTGLAFSTSFDVMLIRERADFMRMIGSDLVSAIAIPGRRLIVVDLSRMAVHPLNLELIMKHEMCHILLHGNVAGGALPRWFDEGICQWVSGGMNEIVSPESGSILRRAAVGGRLIPFYLLSDGFPGDRTGFSLAYEQSLDMIEFLSDEYGSASIRKILSLMNGGQSFREAVRGTIGSPFEEVEKEWREGLRLKYSWISYILDNFTWFIFVAGAVLTALGFFLFRKRMKAYPEEDMENNDPFSPQ